MTNINNAPCNDEKLTSQQTYKPHIIHMSTSDVEGRRYRQLSTRGIQDFTAMAGTIEGEDDGNILQLPSGGNTTYTGCWTTFQLRNESLITEARSDEIAHRLNVHQIMTGRLGSPKTKLNQRIRQLAFQHNMVKHLTMTIKSSWHGYTHDNTYISECTLLVFHPTLIELRMHGFGSRIIAEGIMFGDLADLQL